MTPADFPSSAGPPAVTMADEPLASPIPADAVMTPIRSGTINKSDFLGTKTCRLADGSTIRHRPSVSACPRLVIAR